MKFQTVIAKNNLRLSFFSGLIIALAYPIFPWLIWVAFLPILFLLTAVKKPSDALKYTTFAGFIYFAWIWSWFLNTYPFDWLGINVVQGLIGAVFITLASALVFAICWGGAGYLYTKLKNKNGVHNLLLFSSVFTLAEYFRSYLFSFVWGAKNVAVGAFYTFGNPGYAVNTLSIFGQLGSIWGLYGFTFMVLTINFLMFMFFSSKKKKYLFIPISIVVLNFIPMFSLDTPTQNKLNIAVVQTNIKSKFSLNEGEKTDIMRQYQETIDPAFKNSPDFVAIPEILRYAGGNYQFLPPPANYPVKPTTVIYGSKYGDEQSSKSVTAFWKTDTQDIQSSEKVFLMPFGEYIPGWINVILEKMAPKWIEKIKSGRSNFISASDHKPLNVGGVNFGGASCSEIFAPTIFSKLAKDGAEIIVIPSSYGVFSPSINLRKQDEAAIKMRAVETGKYIVQPMNYGRSYVVDNHGKIIASTKKLGSTHINTEVKLNSNKTIYTRLGDWVILLSVVLLTILVTMKFKKTA